MSKKVLVIGAGLAGSEAAFYLAEKGINVVLFEAKTKKLNPAQKLTTFAELVCTNSLKSMVDSTPHGLLKLEMKAFGSIILKTAYKHQVPAGDALAVNRESFSTELTQILSLHPLIQIIHEDVSDPNKLLDEYKADFAIVASGPLTTDPLTKWIMENVSGEDFYFYDAIAPVVDSDSLDYSKLYFKDRHEPYDPDSDKRADYLNAPMNKEEYEKFVEALATAEKVPAKDFENYKYFESCLPIDTMAERGKDTPRFSCMKPIGLERPDGTRPYACVQLRRENLLGDAFNLVGFQTRLTYKEQLRVFRMIPGFENASFIHLGSVHRNSYLNSKKLLNEDFSSTKFSKIHFAGQMTGVEGYTESASMGLYVAFQVYRKLLGKEAIKFPIDTAFGALVNYVFTAPKPVPSNINMGLFPSVELSKEQRKRRSEIKSIKKEMILERAKKSLEEFLKEHSC